MNNTGLFVDLDGTLLNKENNFVDNIPNLFSQIKENGHKIFLCTGKFFNDAKNIESKMNVKLNIIASCGQRVFINGNEIFTWFLDYKHLTNFFNEYLTSFQEVIIEKKNKVLFIDEIKEIEDFKEIISLNFKYNDVKDKNQANKIIKELNNKFRRLSFSFYLNDNEFFFTCNSKSNSKGKAIKIVQRLLKLDYLVGIGNGWSDISMFKAVDYSIATQNANVFLKKQSSFVSKYSNNENVVFIELKKIFDL